MWLTTSDDGKNSVEWSDSGKRASLSFEKPQGGKEGKFL